MMKRNRVAHFQSGSSDKIYIASIRPNTSGKFDVLGKWGPRNGNVQLQVKGTYSTESQAIAAMENLFREKTVKGYRNIEDQSYHGSVTIQSVVRHLEAEPGVVALPADDDEFADAIKNSSRIQASNAEKEKAREEKAKLDLLKSRAGKLPVRQERVKCINNLGMEERFELDGEYMAELHADKEMLWVTDASGIRDEFFATRFRIVKG